MRSFRAAKSAVLPALLLLLKTFIDIIALRKGPESIPGSPLVLSVALVLMLISAYAASTLIDITSERDYFVTWGAYGMGIAFYGAVIFVSGHPSRLLSAISSIIACGSLITLMFVAEFVLLSPLLGRDVAGLLATLIIFWSVPVEGHIVARAIGRHWFVGIVIAVMAFILQYGIQEAARAPA